MELLSEQPATSRYSFRPRNAVNYSDACQTHNESHAKRRINKKKASPLKRIPKKNHETTRPGGTNCQSGNSGDGLSLYAETPNPVSLTTNDISKCRVNLRRLSDEDIQGILAQYKKPQKLATNSGTVKRKAEEHTSTSWSDAVKRFAKAGSQESNQPLDWNSLNTTEVPRKLLKFSRRCYTNSLNSNTAIHKFHQISDMTGTLSDSFEKLNNSQSDNTAAAVLSGTNSVTSQNGKTTKNPIQPSKSPITSKNPFAIDKKKTDFGCQVTPDLIDNNEQDCKPTVPTENSVHQTDNNLPSQDEIQHSSQITYPELWSELFYVIHSDKMNQNHKDILIDLKSGKYDSHLRPKVHIKSVLGTTQIHTDEELVQLHREKHSITKKCSDFYNSEDALEFIMNVDGPPLASIIRLLPPGVVKIIRAGDTIRTVYPAENFYVNIMTENLANVTKASPGQDQNTPQNQNVYTNSSTFDEKNSGETLNHNPLNRGTPKLVISSLAKGTYLADVVNIPDCDMVPKPLKITIMDQGTNNCEKLSKTTFNKVLNENVKFAKDARALRKMHGIKFDIKNQAGKVNPTLFPSYNFDKAVQNIKDVVNSNISELHIPSQSSTITQHISNIRISFNPIENQFSLATQPKPEPFLGQETAEHCFFTSQESSINPSQSFQLDINTRNINDFEQLLNAYPTVRENESNMPAVNLNSNTFQRPTETMLVETRASNSILPMQSTSAQDTGATLCCKDLPSTSGNRTDQQLNARSHKKRPIKRKIPLSESISRKKSKINFNKNLADKVDKLLELQENENSMETYPSFCSDYKNCYYPWISPNLFKAKKRYIYSVNPEQDILPSEEFYPLFIVPKDCSQHPSQQNCVFAYESYLAMKAEIISMFSSSFDVSNIDHKNPFIKEADIPEVLRPAFRGYKVAGDGNCGFYSLSFSTTLDVKFAKILRRIGLLELLYNTDTKASLINMTAENIKQLELSLSRNDTWLNSDGIQLLSKVLDRNIVVYTMSPNNELRGTTYRNGAMNQPIYIYTDGAHFVPLLKLNNGAVPPSADWKYPGLRTEPLSKVELQNMCKPNTHIEEITID